LFLARSDIIVFVIVIISADSIVARLFLPLFLRHNNLREADIFGKAIAGA
jgi:hypothetical protein